MAPLNRYPENVHLFLNPAQDLDRDIQRLNNKGVDLRVRADWATIDTFCRTQLTMGCSENSRLLVFWSGHGCTSRGERIFFCQDYTERLPNRVFNAFNFLRHLMSSNFRCFSDQIFLADTCGVYTELPIVNDCEYPSRIETTRQIAYFAAPEGKYASGSDDRGVFTETVLKVLQQTDAWPDHTFSQRLESALHEIGTTPLRIQTVDESGETRERLVGSVPEAEWDSQWFHSVFMLLRDLEVVESMFRPHYRRTVIELGIPKLHKAQGLTGVLENLSSLRDGHSTKNIPYSLLQFLVRLAKEDALREPINEWLETNVIWEKDILTEIKRKLQTEQKLKILMVVVRVNEANEKIGSYRPYVCDSDFMLVPDYSFTERTFAGWEDFKQSLQELLVKFRVDGRLSNLEIHFLADPPLFDLPFHLIPVAPGEGTTIGEQAVVVLRNRRRILSPDLYINRNWNKYSDALRPMRPTELKWLRVDLGSAPLPREKGLYFAAFALTPRYEGQAGHQAEKRVISRLLDLGVPYLYLPHALPQGADWEAIGSRLTEVLGEIQTIDGYPVEFMNERIAGNDIASLGTILWDDPQSNPFTLTRGPSDE